MAEPITRDPSRDRELVESIRAGEPMHIKQGPLISTIASASLARLLDLATAGLDAVSHPAALERARAEERERIDDLPTGLNVDPIKAAPEAHVGDFYAGVDAGINAALDAIRALGPVPRPSPEAEPVDLSGGPPNDKLKTLYAEGRAMLATPPAMAPELRERLAKVLQWAGGLGNSIYSPEARALLFALSPQTDGGAG